MKSIGVIIELCVTCNANIETRLQGVGQWGVGAVFLPGTLRQNKQAVLIAMIPGIRYFVSP